LYGQKQAGHGWNQHLHPVLTDKLSFTQSKVDPCIYYRGMLFFLLYTDDSILITLDDSEINRVIKELSKHFNITDQGQIDDYLGVKVERKSNGGIKLSQPPPMELIMKDLKFVDEVKPNEMPAPSTVILNKDQDGEDFDESFHSRAGVWRQPTCQSSYQATCCQQVPIPSKGTSGLVVSPPLTVSRGSVTVSRSKLGKHEEDGGRGDTRQKVGPGPRTSMMALAMQMDCGTNAKVTP
jgi:hypothetical protein